MMRLQHMAQAIDRVKRFTEGKSFADFMVVGMRNYIVHEYFQVDDNVVWDVVTHDLPVLEKQITAYIEEFAE